MRNGPEASLNGLIEGKSHNPLCPPKALDNGEAENFFIHEGDIHEQTAELSGMIAQMAAPFGMRSAFRVFRGLR